MSSAQWVARPVQEPQQVFVLTEDLVRAVAAWFCRLTLLYCFCLVLFCVVWETRGFPKELE